MTQLYGIGVTIAYTAVATAIILYVVKAIVGLRPSEAAEEEGLDITLHGETVQ
jgi:Amt family ammonium transporter